MKSVLGYAHALELDWQVPAPAVAPQKEQPACAAHAPQLVRVEQTDDAPQELAPMPTKPPVQRVPAYGMHDPADDDDAAQYSHPFVAGLIVAVPQAAQPNDVRAAHVGAAVHVAVVL